MSENRMLRGGDAGSPKPAAKATSAPDSGKPAAAPMSALSYLRSHPNCREVKLPPEGLAFLLTGVRPPKPKP